MYAISAKALRPATAQSAAFVGALSVSTYCLACRLGSELLATPAKMLSPTFVLLFRSLQCLHLT
ncbi:MAG: hypothetical protein JWL63_2734 [Rhodocyclales bacterium]|nr:hypothetical protein [Rhodocyclales bacterium]